MSHVKEPEIVLTAREQALVEYIVDEAVKRMWERFYANVGKWTVQRVLVWLGVVTLSALTTLKVVGKI